MIRHFTKPFFQALTHVFSNKTNLILTLIPLTLAIVVYGFGVSYMYGILKEWLHNYLKSTIDSEAFGVFAYYSLMAFLSILVFFLINWTFVLLASIIASPFNTLISERIAASMKLNPKPPLVTEGFFRRSLWIIFLETKKVIVIAVLSLVTMVAGYVPLLTPIALLMTFLLIAVQFVDYSWSRYDYSVSKCVKDTFGHIFFYIPSGGLFFLFINIPIANLFIPSIATAYYTIYWEERTYKNTSKSS